MAQITVLTRRKEFKGRSLFLSMIKIFSTLAIISVYLKKEFTVSRVCTLTSA